MRSQRGSRQRGGGLGPVGQCVCVKCGYTIPKKTRVPCMNETCPNCGTVLFREGGTHYLNAKKNKEV